MKYGRPARMLALALLGAELAGCASHGNSGKWNTLIDGSNGLEHFQRAGDGNWQAVDGTIQASQGKSMSYIVSKTVYSDFRIRVEFWASDDANSGVFLRCQNPTEISAENCYEANIFDQRPDPTYGTGAIVLLAKAPDPMPKAGGKWNTYDITMNGAHLTLVLNGVTTVDIEDAKLAGGHVALQWASGTIKFRKVQIQPL